MKTLIKGFLLINFVLLTSCGKSPDQAAGSVKDIKSRPVYKELTTEIITSLKDEDLEQAIFDNISIKFEGDTRGIKEKIESLTAGQRAVYVTWIVEAEVMGGGLKNYYTKSGALLAPFVKEAFQTIGATRYAETMETANLVYSSIQQDKEKAKGSPYAALDEKFEDLANTESLDALKVIYIRSNAEEFVGGSKQ